MLLFKKIQQKDYFKIIFSIELTDKSFTKSSVVCKIRKRLFGVLHGCQNVVDSSELTSPTWSSSRVETMNVTVEMRTIPKENNANPCARLLVHGYSKLEIKETKEH